MNDIKIKLTNITADKLRSIIISREECRDDFLDFSYN